MKYALAAAAVLLATPVLAMGPMNTMLAPQAMPAQLQPGESSELDRDSEKHHAQLRAKLLALRDEGLKLRDADGGTLTDAHRAYLQHKLDALHVEESGGE